MWCGIKELTQIYHGDYADPEIVYKEIGYKGIKFNEYDLIDIVGNQLEELFEYEHKTVDNLISDGILTEAVREKTFEHDTSDIIDDYLHNPLNHESILGNLEDLIFRNYEREDYMNTLAEKASYIIETDEDIDNDYQCNLISAISTWANGNESKKAIVDDFFKNKNGETIEDLLYYEYTNNLRDFVDRHEISMENLEPYVIYLMNHEYDVGYNLDEIKDLSIKATKRFGDVPCVVVNAKGEYVGKGYVTETGFKGEIKGLTTKENEKKQEQTEER